MVTKMGIVNEKSAKENNQQEIVVGGGGGEHTTEMSNTLDDIDNVEDYHTSEAKKQRLREQCEKQVVLDYRELTPVGPSYRQLPRWCPMASCSGKKDLSVKQVESLNDYSKVFEKLT